MQVNDTSSENAFSWIDELLQSGNVDDAFDGLVERFRRARDYRRVFDARLMKKRLDLHLPLVSQPSLAELPEDLQRAYQDAQIDAAREVGELFLADGDISAAWPYYRAIGNTEPIVKALDRLDVNDPETPEAQERLGTAIQIAFQDGVNPRKGFELILRHYGLCRAITMFSAYPPLDGRDESLRLLVRSLHDQVVENLAHAIEAVEGTRPEHTAIAPLIAGRDWLFENNAQYTDSSHLVPVLKFSMELQDEETLRLAVALADYGARLGPMFQFTDDPPFDRVYEDRGIYLRALIGEEVDRAVKHFDEKAARFDSAEYGTQPAETLVDLLVRLERYNDAIDAFRRYLAEVAPEHLSCPSLPQLCQMAGDFDQLRDVAEEHADPLSYMAAAIQRTSTEESSARRR
jgi:hypothetical protein